MDWSVLWTVLNLIVLYFLLKKFLLGPVNAVMEQRQQQITGSLQKADEEKEKAEQLRLQYEQAIKGVKTETEQMLQQAKEKADRVYQKKLDEAKEEVSRMQTQAQQRAEAEKQRIRKEARAEIADIAMLAASKVIQENLDQEKNEKLLEEFLKEAGGNQ